MAEMFWAEIEEIPENICGVIDYDKHAFFIICTEDDPIDREYTVHTVYDDRAPDTTTHMFISNLNYVRNKKNTALHRTVKILKQANKRSIHFPKLIAFGKLKKLIFGENGDQQDEHDPEWIGRSSMILQYDGTLIASVYSLSPTGTVPMELALIIGIGCVRALAALHRLGYVHRQVSPYTFSFLNPISYDSIESRMLITDVSLALPWPCRPRPFVPFVGTLRYSSVRAHENHEQGPSDDIISLIYILAEMISGKLPWRSVASTSRIYEMKCEFYTTIEFKRLPKELRSLYKTMYLTASPLAIDHAKIIEVMRKTIERRFPETSRELPHWLSIPVPDD